MITADCASKGVIHKHQVIDNDDKNQNKTAIDAEVDNENISHTTSIIEDELVTNEDESDPCDSTHGTVFHCTACSKFFKTAKGCLIHERSKKHKDNIRTIGNLLVEEVSLGSNQQQRLNRVESSEEATEMGADDYGKENFLEVCETDCLTRSNSLNLLSHTVKKNVIEKILKNSVGASGEEDSLLSAGSDGKGVTSDLVEVIVTDS